MSRLTYTRNAAGRPAFYEPHTLWHLPSAWKQKHYYQLFSLSFRSGRRVLSVKCASACDRTDKLLCAVMKLAFGRNVHSGKLFITCTLAWTLLLTCWQVGKPKSVTQVSSYGSEGQKIMDFKLTNIASLIHEAFTVLLTSGRREEKTER